MACLRLLCADLSLSSGMNVEIYLLLSSTRRVFERMEAGHLSTALVHATSYSTTRELKLGEFSTRLSIYPTFAVAVVWPHCVLLQPSTRLLNTTVNEWKLFM